MRFFKALPLILLVFYANQASAVVSFLVKNEDVSKTRIVFFGFNSAEPNLNADGAEILGTIQRNLDTTDLFEFSKLGGGESMASSQSSADASPEVGNVDAIPDFSKYSTARIDAVIIAKLGYDVSGNLEVRIRMWDILDRRQLFGKFYTASRDNYRKMSQVISNEIYKAITGEKSGHFNSQIVYTSESGSPTKRTKKIKIIDFDGSNERSLTDGEDLVLTPVFSMSKDEVYYLRYANDKPQIYVVNLQSSRSKRMGNFKGTTFSPFPHPKDPNLLLISAIFDGNSDIYEMDLKNNSAKRLTKNPGIDTTPSYSPDGKRIAFSSDRDSGQQIYLMDENGNYVKRVSSGSGTYSKPVWSPDGKLLAFTRIKGGKFFIGTMSPDGKGEKLLANGYLVEGAKWSPNGRYIVYSKTTSAFGQGSIPRLYTVDIITGFEHVIATTPGEGATDPDWR